eukprot:CAMPEP_0171461170 /NCGR_PEP_ID=MMETSP0945-20130129/5731_1 /TAXON_ID=109269 /ORGANISM="Vaucheria litorea, Strain CCMP2940" /LENGTH=761 /DNA_ID=CAMNT_0011987475 /DNA_START=176 /DNA_END=2461 /DNA_ORIENTATION=-
MVKEAIRVNDAKSVEKGGIEIQPMRPACTITWKEIKEIFKDEFDFKGSDLKKYDEISKEDLAKAYEMMQLSRQFENACTQAYMQQHVRGFMHLDNGQETIPAFVSDSIKKSDIKYSYYREHTHALSSGVSPEKVMCELFGKNEGTCRGAGGSMHIFDKETNFQGGWALVGEQLPYAVGAARSILLDRHLNKEELKNDDRVTIVFLGEGAGQNGRMAECLNAASKEKLPIIFLIIDNGRAINTFTPDVAANSDIYKMGKHYNVPGVVVNGQSMVDVLRTGRIVTDYARVNGPVIMQVHTYRFNGHSPADPEHERGRKEEKRWARSEMDPLALFEAQALNEKWFTKEELGEISNKVKKQVKECIDFSIKAPTPPRELAKQLEYPDPPETDYSKKIAPIDGAEITGRTLDHNALKNAELHMEAIRSRSEAGQVTIGDAVNLAIIEEMIRDPRTTIHAEDLQAGSSYDIPKLTQQTFGKLRAADEIIDEGHFIGKALGEGMNGYRPIIELMNTNFGIYGMAEISSAGNTYATTGGQFKMPMTIVGAGGTSPNQALGAEHSQPLHAYVMGIPGLKICAVSTPDAAYGIMKSMIRDDGPGMLFLPVKMMKSTRGSINHGKCMPLNKAALIHRASDESIAKGRAVTVLTYLHGVFEVEKAMKELKEMDMEVDLVELRSLKPLDMDTIHDSVSRTHRVVILDESTLSGGVGATVSAIVSEKLFDELDAPVKRLCMDDAPVPYASAMEEAVVKRAADVVRGVAELVNRKV